MTAPDGDMCMRLFLLRHTKSDWGEDGLADFDRPLNSRGKTAARAIGRHMKENSLYPNRILCSTSQRTRETLSRILTYQPRETQIHLLSDIYEQEGLSYSGLIRHHGGRSQNLMVIGHNPAIEQTAEELIGTGDAAAISDMRMKYPTGALTIIDFDITDWADLQTGTGHLAQYVKPRDLTAVLQD